MLIDTENKFMFFQDRVIAYFFFFLLKVSYVVYFAEKKCVF